MLNFDKAQKLFDTIKAIDRIKNSDDDDRIDALFTAIKDIDRKDIGHEFEDIIIDSMRDALHRSYKEEIDRMNGLVDKPCSKTALETLAGQTEPVKWDVLDHNVEVPSGPRINASFTPKEVKDIATVFNLSNPEYNKDHVSHYKERE